MNFLDRSKIARITLLSSLTKFGIIMSLILISFIISEIGLRIIFSLGWKDIHSYQPSFIYAHLNQTQFDRRRFISHPFLPYIPRPFDKRVLHIYRPDVNKWVTYDYEQNSLGFRTPERPFVKPPYTKRIITLGGSTTWDGPTNDQTWPALLEDKLNNYYARYGYTIEVINMAVDGYNSAESLITLTLLGIEFEPDLIISYDGVNDMLVQGYIEVTPDYRSTMSKFDDQYFTLQSRLPVYFFRSYIITIASWIYDRIFSEKSQDINGQVLAKTRRLTRSNDTLAGIEYFMRNLRLMRAIAEEYNAKFLASTAHWVSPNQDQNRQNILLREFFKKNQINYVDVDAILPHNDWSIHVDQVHWTRKGLDKIAEAYMNKITSEDLLNFN